MKIYGDIFIGLYLKSKTVFLLIKAKIRKLTAIRNLVDLTTLQQAVIPQCYCKTIRFTMYLLSELLKLDLKGLSISQKSFEAQNVLESVCDAFIAPYLSDSKEYDVIIL